MHAHDVTVFAKKKKCNFTETVMAVFKNVNFETCFLVCIFSPLKYSCVNEIIYIYIIKRERETGFILSRLVSYLGIIWKKVVKKVIEKSDNS